MLLFWEYVKYGKWNLGKTLTKSDSVSLIHIYGCTFGNYYGENRILFATVCEGSEGYENSHYGAAA